jgi:hypothetical protein
MFRELVTFCTSNKICSSTFEQMLQTDFVLKTTCNSLCHLFARYLFYREIHTARICAADQRQCLEEYLKDHQTYEKLIQCEIDMLTELGVNFANNSTVNNETSVLVTKIAFIGSGPIPNSSMTILNDYAPYADIYNIDMCEEANQLASRISEQILPSHLSKRMHFITQDITEEPLPVQVKSILNQCQLIYLATVVGMNELEKLNILKNIVNQSNDDLEKKSIQYFVIRTTEGFWQIFFPKVTAEKIAMLQATNDSDVRNDINGKFLFQIKAVQHIADKYGITRIIATNIN